MSSRASEIKVNVLPRADTPSLVESMINAQELKATLVYLAFPPPYPGPSTLNTLRNLPFISLYVMLRT